MTTTANGAQAVAVTQKQSKDDQLMEYNVAGNKVQLSKNIVRNYLTKGSRDVSDADLIQFMSICKFNQLNPFLNEAYLVKYGTNPAQMIVSKEALLKRADACEEYEGMQAGVIVEHQDGTVEDVEGSFYGKTDNLVGGWCKVYRRGKRFPFVSRVRLDEYDTGKSLWTAKKSTMITKVAKVQALREAFPSQLGAMYTTEEAGIEDAVAEEVKEEIKHKANRQTVSFDNSQPSQPVTTATFDATTVPDATEATAEDTTVGPGY